MNINGINKNRAAITEFNGLKIRNNSGASDFVDMQNIDSHEYPYFSTRRKNYYINKATYGMGVQNVEENMRGCCAYDTDLYYMILRGDNLQMEKLNKTGTTSVVINATEFFNKSYYSNNENYKIRERKMVVMGGDIVIYPDWIKYNIKDNKAYSLKKTISIDYDYAILHPNEAIPVFMCTENGNAFAEYRDTKQSTLAYDYSCVCCLDGYFTIGEPKTYAKAEDKYYFQFEGNGNQKKGSVSKFYSSSSMWMIEDEYCYIDLKYDALGYASFNDLKQALIDMDFNFGKVLDVSLKASGISAIFNGQINGQVVLHKIRNINDTYARFIFKGINIWNDAWELRKTGGSPDTVGGTYVATYIVVQIPDTTVGGFASFKLENDLYLSFDFMVQEGNRLFACSSQNHEIYASKLGDPSMWKEFKGISTDSYAATIGSPGSFTGAAVFNNTPIFFKENCIHRITGNTPASFNVSYDYYDGILSGCSKSIVRVGNYLIYYSKGGWVYYTGTQPEKIDRQLGDKRYKNVIAGEKEGHYFAIATDKDTNETYRLEYDMELNQWYKHKDHNPKTLNIINVSNDLYTFHKEKCADYTSLNNLLHTFIECIGRNLNEAQTATPEDDFEWYAESGWLIKESTNKKYITKLLFKMHLDPMADIRIYLKYDYNDEWNLFKSYSNTNDYPETLSLPLIPQRCESMQYKIEGKGKIIIYSITYDISEGSEL